ncbi:MAG: hypothetical protein AABX70_06100 [Nanoarchaeota archaeon]
MTGLADIVKKASMLVIPSVLAANVMFGLEPQIMLSPPDSPIRRTSFREYVMSAGQIGYNSLFSKIAVASVYPGACLGAYMHNILLVDSDVNKRE